MEQVVRHIAYANGVISTDDKAEEVIRMNIGSKSNIAVIQSRHEVLIASLQKSCRPSAIKAADDHARNAKKVCEGIHAQGGYFAYEQGVIGGSLDKFSMGTCTSFI